MDPVVFTATIAQNESISNAVKLGERKHVGLIMPPAWTAADITFQVSADGTTFVNLYDKTGAEVVYKAVAGAGIQISDFDLAPWSHIKIRSSVNQADDREILVVMK